MKFTIKHPQTTVGTIEKIVEKEIDKQKEKEKKKAVVKPVGDKSKKTETAATTAQEKEQGPVVIHITGLDQPLHEKEREATQGKGPKVVKPTKPNDVNVRSGAFTAGQAGVGSPSTMPHPLIGPKDTLGDIYYKTYIEEARGDAPHHPPWSLKQKDTFLEFAPCRDWYLNSFPPGEVNRQRARTHDGLYHAYVVGEANTCAANHQIGREWCTMVKERGDWEKYHDRLLRQVKDFKKMKAALAEEKATFEAETKYEEWGREGLRTSFVPLRSSCLKSELIGKKCVRRTISTCVQLTPRLCKTRLK
ncbi:hypothetical protein Hanom_Chr04g00338511 [Helianthus anomalus]